MVFPVPLVMELVVMGALLLLFKRTKRAGRVLMAMGILLLYVCSLPLVGDSLLLRLEAQSHALDVAALDPSTNYVVGVAGNGVRFCNSGCKGCFNDYFLVRLQEAGRICSRLESSAVRYKLVVSAVADMPEQATRAAVCEYFSAFGIPEERIELVGSALNSRMEVAAFGQRPGRLILVSNAFHLPRLMRLAADQQHQALAAPAGFKAALKPGGGLWWIPSAEALDHTRIYVYERLGMLFP